MRKRVLVAAQEVELRAKIARVLHLAGYAVEIAESQKRAFELAAGGDIEAAIVVPTTDLSDLGHTLRDKIPKMIVLGHGSDDIVRRGPRGSHAELALDEQKLLDRLGQPPTAPQVSVDGLAVPPSTILKIDGCELDLAGHIFVDRNGREVPLTRAETKLLAAFVDKPRRVLSRDQLRRAVVGRGSDPYDRNVDMLVARLRRKIELDAKSPAFILTVPGVGYKFAVQPEGTEDSKSLSAIELDQFNGSGVGEVTRAGTPSQEIPSRRSEPERRQVTALSCGLVGSATLAANFDPEDLGWTLGRFQDVCATVVKHWGGAIINSVGDEILASFGYPKGHEDDAERAVHAGLDLVAKIGELRSHVSEPLKVRIGIATGLVLIGENQSVVGEAIAAAPRFRNIAPPKSVIVAASTRKLIGNVFACDNPELCKLEGIPEPVTAYRVTGKRAIGSRFVARKGAGTPTQFVGRQNELQQLSTLWERIKSGKGHVALVCGEAGIGKSRLIEAWLDRIADEPHIIIRCHCSPHHTNSAFYPIIAQLEHAARFEREDTPGVKLKKLETMLTQAGAATLADTPFFAALLSIRTNGFCSSLDVTPQRQRDLTIAALIRQILALALIRPVVIVLADVHWIDSSTLELLNQCIGAIKTARVFVLISFRPEFFPRWLGQSQVTMLRLDRLSHEQIGAIVRDVGGDKELPRGLHEQIINKADGVPLFAEELTKTVIESGPLQGTGDQHAVLVLPSPLAIPTILLGSLTARLDRLGPVKEIAQIAAAIGREFSYRMIAAVSSVSGTSLQAALAQLAGCELIFARGEPPESTYVFKHALVQDAAYATMVRSKRQQLHSRIANALIEDFHETVETQPELMAYHLAQAGSTERAIEYLQKAGRRALERSANSEAIAHLTCALEMLQSFPNSPEIRRAALGLQVTLGQAMIVDRGYAAPETRETLLRAKELIDDLTEPSQKFAILYAIWACHYVGGEISKQRDAALEFLTEAERHNDTAVLCVAHRLLGTACVTRGEFAAGLHHLERARALYDFEHHSRYRHEYGQDIGAAALCYLSWALWHLGYVDQASAVAAEAVKHAEGVSHPHTLVYTICHARGFMDLFKRRYEDIQSYAGLIVSLCTENGFSHWVNCGRILEGWAEICQGEADHGIELLRAGVAAWQKRGARLWLPMFLTLEAEACAQAGHGDAALEAIEEALAISKDTGERWAMAEALRVKAHLLQATGRAEAKEIETILINSLEIARAQQARCWELRASCDLARLWQGQGQVKKALKLLQSVYNQFTEGFDTAHLRNAKALMEDLRRSVGPKQDGCAGEEPNKTKCR